MSNGKRPNSTRIGFPTPGYTPGGVGGPGSSAYKNPPPRDSTAIAAADFGIAPPSSVGSPRLTYNSSNNSNSIIDAIDSGNQIREQLQAMTRELEEALQKAQSAQEVAQRARNIQTINAVQTTQNANRARQAAVDAAMMSTNAAVAANAATQAQAVTQEQARKVEGLVAHTEKMINNFKGHVAGFITSRVASATQQQQAAFYRQQQALAKKIEEIDQFMQTMKSTVDELKNSKSATPLDIASTISTLTDSSATIGTTITSSNISNSEASNENNNDNNEFLQTEKLKTQMGISFIKFKVITNILNTLARNQKTMNQINPVLPVNFDVNFEELGQFSDIPIGNYLFINNFKLRKRDFQSMSRSDFIKLICNPLEFIKFLKMLRKNDKERVFYNLNKPKLSLQELDIYKNNALIYANILFSEEQSFNIVDPRRRLYYQYTIMNHVLDKTPYKLKGGQDATKYDLKPGKIDTTQRNDYVFFDFKIELVLDKRSSFNIDQSEIKKVGCKQRRIKIYQILGSLKETKNALTYILGERDARKYLVDDTEMEELHSEAKPLPSKRRDFAKRVSMADKLQLVSRTQDTLLPMSEVETLQDVRSQQSRGMQAIPSTSLYSGGGIKERQKIKKTRKIYMVEDSEQPFSRKNQHTRKFHKTFNSYSNSGRRPLSKTHKNRANNKKQTKKQRK